jgi:glutathione S-transferase
MQLFYSTTSPYVRKVRVTAIEKGLAGQIDLRLANAHGVDEALRAANPLSRIPTLILNDGSALYDSPVICAWLDAHGEGPQLIPVSGAEQWAVRRTEALADGMLDDAVAVVMERRRAMTQEDPVLQTGRIEALQRACARLEADLPTLPGTLTLGHIAAGCALGYLGFRLPELDWHSAHPRLADWYLSFAERAAMVATVPVDTL